MSISKYLPYLPTEEQLKQETERQKAVFYMQHPLQIGKTVRTMSNERKQSKLDELIQKYCPEGVSYISIKDLIKQKSICTITPSFKIKRNDYKESGSVPIISQEQEYISGYCERSDNNITQKNYVCFGDHSEHIKYVDFAFVQGADGLKIMHTNENIILARYLYHTALAYYKRHDNYERHFKYFGDTAIPLPPLEVQSEIVRILDNFTELTAELTAELIARKKQYEFYRNKLLTFGDAQEGATSNVVRRALGEVCYISAGGDAPKDSMSKQKTEKYSVPIISNGIGENALYGYTDSAKIEEPAVTVAARGTIGYAEYRDYPFYPIIRLLTAIPKDKTVVNTKYLYYCLQGKRYSIPMGGIPQLTAPELKKVEIPIPSLDVQNRLVDVLDNFDAICADLNIGLPAEIEARQKQYEYYRDALLTYAATSKTIFTDRQTDRQTDR